MKYTILGFNQKKVCAITKEVQIDEEKIKIYKLDITDLAILQDIADFMNRKNIIKYTINEKIYFSITHKAILQDLPLLDIKKQALKDRIDKMCLLGVIEKQVVRNEFGTWIGYRLTDVYENLLYSNDDEEVGVYQTTQGGCSKLHGGGVVNYNPYNYTTIKEATINNNKEKEDKSSLKKKPKEFIPPTIQEVEAYIKEKGYSFNAKAFIDYYEADDWHYGTGANRKKVSNWKRCCITWGEKRTNNNDLFAQTFDNHNEDNAMQKFLALSDSEQASVLRLDAYQYHMLSSKGKSEWIKNRKQFILQWATSNG